MKSYTELDAWKHARNLVKDIYLLSNSFPPQEIYGLTSQIRRASVSVPSNIAEGIGRNHNRDSIQFLFIAKASLNEIETQLYLAFDLGFCNKELLEELLNKVIETRKLLIGFIKYKESQ
jgi:four helix bundle protein